MIETPKHQKNGLPPYAIWTITSPSPSLARRGAKLSSPFQGEAGRGKISIKSAKLQFLMQFLFRFRFQKRFFIFFQ
ncbi:hypothetical protein UZ36_01835 [Candidatus Nitromaritima sp. SCGC AAA799-C22]|nr:hypothetical protein UZ36_01835 [Candidatus Nitromaritima sp. SCGC AAA799-C22]